MSRAVWRCRGASKVQRLKNGHLTGFSHAQNKTLFEKNQMNNQPKRRGGVRPGAGRPKSGPVLLPDLPATNDPLAFLLALVNEPTADMRLRLNAAVAAMPYVHAKAVEAGVKDRKQDAAKKASAGKFAPSHAPVRLVT